MTISINLREHQSANLLEEQHELLQEQQRLLRLLLGTDRDELF